MYSEDRTLLASWWSNSVEHSLSYSLTRLICWLVEEEEEKEEEEEEENKSILVKSFILHWLGSIIMQFSGEKPSTW